MPSFNNFTAWSLEKPSSLAASFASFSCPKWGFLRIKSRKISIFRSVATWTGSGAIFTPARCHFPFSSRNGCGQLAKATAEAFPACWSRAWSCSSLQGYVCSWIAASWSSSWAGLDIAGPPICENHREVLRSLDRFSTTSNRGWSRAGMEPRSHRAGAVGGYAEKSRSLTSWKQTRNLGGAGGIRTLYPHWLHASYWFL